MSKHNISFSPSEIFSEFSHLEEAAPEDGDAARPVEVDQLEDVGPALGDHGHSQQEQHDTQAYCELSADGPVVGMEIFLQARE